MWKVALVVLSASVVTARDIVQCTEEFVAQHGSLLSIPGSCQKFVVCVSGRLEERDCPSNTLFDVDSNRCISEVDAKCSSQTRSRTNGLCSVADEVSTHPDPYHCSRYVLCLGVTAIPRECSAGLLFNKETGKCDFPQNVDCDVSCPSGGNDLVFLPEAGRRNCARYFVCLNGKAHPTECSSMLYFDLVTGTCVHPAEASCSIQGVLCPQYDVNVADPRSCSSFYKCEGGFPHYRECEAGRHFNDGQCVPGDCDDRITEETDSTTEIESSTTAMSPTTSEVQGTTETSEPPATQSTTVTSTIQATTTETSTETDSTVPSTSTVETSSTSTSTSTSSSSTTESTTASQTESPATQSTTIPSTIPVTTTESSTETDSTITSTSTVETSTLTPTEQTSTSSSSSSTTESSTISPTEQTTSSSSIIESTTASQTAPPVTQSTTVTSTIPVTTTESSTETDSTVTSTSTMETSTLPPTEQTSTSSPSNTTESTTESPTEQTTADSTTDSTTSSGTPSTTEPSSTTTTLPPTLDPAEMCRDMEIGVIPHPYNCYQYFVCIFGSGREVTCADGHIFDTQTLSCVPGDRDTC